MHCPIGQDGGAGVTTSSFDINLPVGGSGSTQPPLGSDPGTGASGDGSGGEPSHQPAHPANERAPRSGGGNERPHLNSKEAHDIEKNINQLQKIDDLYQTLQQVSEESSAFLAELDAHEEPDLTDFMEFSHLSGWARGPRGSGSPGARPLIY